MPLMQSRANITWEGNLTDGAGRVSVGSGAFPEQAVTLSSRTETADENTNPEELIAAAHATCYAMALSSVLGKNGTPPGRIEVSAVCSLERAGEGLKIEQMDLTVSGEVPGLDPSKARELAQAAEQACPVSNALRGNVDIRLHVEL